MINSLHKCNFFPMALLRTTKTPQYFTDLILLDVFAFFSVSIFRTFSIFRVGFFLTAYSEILEYGYYDIQRGPEPPDSD